MHSGANLLLFVACERETTTRSMLAIGKKKRQIDRWTDRQTDRQIEREGGFEDNYTTTTTAT